MAMLLPRCWKNSTGNVQSGLLRAAGLNAGAIPTASETIEFCRRIVERASQEEVTVDYANDLDTKR